MVVGLDASGPDAHCSAMYMVIEYSHEFLYLSIDLFVWVPGLIVWTVWLHSLSPNLDICSLIVKVKVPKDDKLGRYRGHLKPGDQPALAVEFLKRNFSEVL